MKRLKVFHFFEHSLGALDVAGRVRANAGRHPGAGGAAGGQGTDPGYHHQHAGFGAAGRARPGFREAIRLHG